MKYEIDSLLGDILFLSQHPGWSYRDLLEAPDDVVMGLRLLDEKHG